MFNKNDKFNRRNFIKKGISGAAAITIAPSVLAGKSAIANSGKSKVITRKLGYTGLELPVVSMGVMRADNPNLVRAAYDKGIVHFDTAHGYQRGKNEEMCGNVLKNKDRDSFVIGTKIPGNRYNKESNDWEMRNNAEEFLEKFELSLKRLQMDYVDILYLHGRKNREETLEARLLEVMVKLKDEGKIKYIGVSTHSNEPEVIQAAIESMIYDIILTAYNFKQDHSIEVGKAIEKASEAGLGVIAMKTQAGVYWDEEDENKINMKAALKWTLQNPHVHTTIPGFQTFDQLAEDLEVLEDIMMTPQEIKDLKLGIETGMTGLYCNQCDECKGQCVGNMDIPTLMRSYMYAFGYKNFAQAKETLLSTELNDFPCEKCEECIIECRAGFNIKQKIEKIYPIKTVPDTFLS
jgi:predicted aldo/keto reductase-like oxidoreductase